MKLIPFWFVSMLIAAGPSDTRQVELILHPSPPVDSAKDIRLLPETEKMTNADAAPLYMKAAQSLPANLNAEQIHQWLQIPPEKLLLALLRQALYTIRNEHLLMEQVE